MAESQRMKLEITDVKERQPIGDRGAVKLEFKAKVDGKELKFFTFSTRLFEAIEGGKGQIIEADVVTTTREGTGDYEGTTFTDRKVTQIYKDGEAVATKYTGGRQYGKSPEELELSRRAFSLSYAKDLAISDKIKVEDILFWADRFYAWLCLDMKPVAIEPKPVTAPFIIKPEDIEQAKGSEELFPEEPPSPDKKPSGAKSSVPKTQEQLFNYVAKHAGHKNTRFTRSYLVNKFKIPESQIDNDILRVYYEVKKLMDWPDYDGE